MNKDKYFKVKEKTNRNGKVIYQVFGAESKFDAIFGFWSKYHKENDSLDEAIQQIKLLHGWGLKSEKTVYETNVFDIEQTA